MSCFTLLSKCFGSLASAISVSTHIKKDYVCMYVDTLNGEK